MNPNNPQAPQPNPGAPMTPITQPTPNLMARPMQAVPQRPQVRRRPQPKRPPLNPNQVKEQQRLAQERIEATFRQGLASVLDMIAPASLVVTPNYLKLNERFVKTLFAYTYPRYIATNWLSEVINYDVESDISIFIYPEPSAEIMSHLRRKATQLESTQSMQQDKGLIHDPELDTAIGDIEELRDTLQRGEMRLFQAALYITLYADNEKDLNAMCKHIESVLGGMLIYTKQSILQMEQGFNSTLPQMTDQLQVTRNLDTGSLSTFFPFTSSSLTSNEGILYGINRHNNSLILFDRFNLENANVVVFAKAGSGKSYLVKLEALRSLMLGTDIMVIDPENEYEMLAEAVGGTFIRLSINSETHLNPFDLPASTGIRLGEDSLRSTITMLHGLVALMVGGLSAEEDALLDKALYETYALKDITTDPASQNNTPPLLGDLQSVLLNMTGGDSLATRLAKYTEGSFSGLFGSPTNFNLQNGMTVFSVRDLEDELRPVGMYLVLNYIWNRVRFDQRKRNLIIDEAWFMMQNEASARFVYSIAKRARKYYLGLTVISQDVEDFIASQYGRSVITNSSMQILLKQSPAAVDVLVDIFNLTDSEKMWLLEANVGEGLFFAGLNHVAIRVVASYTEDQLITTDPRQILNRQNDEAEAATLANEDAANRAFAASTTPVPGTVTESAVNSNTNSASSNAPTLSSTGDIKAPATITPPTEPPAA